MGKQAADAKRLNAFAMNPNDLVIIGFDTEDGPEHPLYDKRCKLPVDEKLARFMLKYGFRGTIEVRKNGDKFEVVYGRRRVKAARLACEMAKAEGTEPLFVACQVKRGSDSDLLGVRIGENIHREEVGMLDTADDLKRFLDMSNSEDDACITFGLSKTAVRNMLKLHDLDSSVRKAVETGDISPSAASELADLDREAQKEALSKMLEAAERGEKPTRQAAKKAVKTSRRGGEEGTSVPVAKRVVNGILRLNELHGKVLNGDFVQGVMWVLGDMPSNRIKGLTALENELEELKTKKAEKKAARKAAKGGKKK